ncbi:hypothetical protein C8Q73DRAFT_707214 [Cubamyces lactineus]|nr:hypothetical protein C8Q73DRAFT_707214 [Cubamyces lactineus]
MTRRASGYALQEPGLVYLAAAGIARTCPRTPDASFHVQLSTWSRLAAEYHDFATERRS